MAHSPSLTVGTSDPMVANPPLEVVAMPDVALSLDKRVQQSVAAALEAMLPGTVRDVVQTSVASTFWAEMHSMQSNIEHLLDEMRGQIQTAENAIQEQHQQQVTSLAGVHNMALELMHSTLSNKRRLYQAELEILAISANLRLLLNAKSPHLPNTSTPSLSTTLSSHSISLHNANTNSIHQIETNPINTNPNSNPLLAPFEQAHISMRNGVFLLRQEPSPKPTSPHNRFQ